MAEATQRDTTATVLATITTTAFFGLVTLLVFHPVPESSKDVLNILVGIVGTAWTGIMGYYFGSSQIAKHQNLLLSEATPQIKTKEEN